MSEDGRLVNGCATNETLRREEMDGRTGGQGVGGGVWG